MRVYSLTHDNADGMSYRAWFDTRRKASARAAALRGENNVDNVYPVEAHDVPTRKADLVRWLGVNANRESY